MKKPSKFTTRRVALCGLFLALALIVSLIESYIPPIIPALPYAKIGLGNVVLLACFLLLGVWEGYIVLVLRCVLSAVFAANTASLIWSLPSALVAYTLMVLLSKIVQHLRTVYCRRNDAQFDADMRCVRRRVERSFRLLAIYDACGCACRACHRDFVPLYRWRVEGEIERRFQRLRVS